jgi:acyl carrier protein
VNAVNTASIREFIVEEFLFGDAGDLQAQSPLFEGGYIDSVGVLDLVAFVERQFGIEVADEELVPENFGTLEVIGVYLGRKLSPAEA